MPAWLTETFNDSPVSLPVLLARLAAAFVLGCIAAFTYFLTTARERASSSRPFLATLVLLSVVIALVTVVIGDNQARAFGLVGALAIVRFRTVVEDTRDTAFVIFAVIVGMAAGAGQIVGALAGTPLVLLAGLLFRGKAALPAGSMASLVLRLGAVRPPEEVLQALLRRHLASHQLGGVATARGGAALDVTYLVKLISPEMTMALVGELSRMEGVQNVEIRER